MAKRKFGWVPDLPDFRDKPHTFKLDNVQHYPSYINLTDLCPPVFDQGPLGSCVFNSVSAAIMMAIREDISPAQLLVDDTPSRLFMYYNTRSDEGTVLSDAGAQIRDAIKSIVSVGACYESEWPYDTTKFTVKPPDECYKAAQQYKAVEYARVDNTDINAIKSVLNIGYPMVFGITVYSSMPTEEPCDGYIPMPQPSDSVEGGHAMLCVGYDDNTKRFIIRNSWGTEWGINGYGSIDYEYLTNQSLCDDCWVIKKTL